MLVLTYFLLLRAFRSLLLPLKAVILNLLSVGASYGMLVVVFRFGVGEDLLGLYRFPQVEGWIPIFLFAMLFGLSMDYEVFLVTPDARGVGRGRRQRDRRRPRARADGADRDGGGGDHVRRVRRASSPAGSSASRSSASGSRSRSSSTRRSSGRCSCRA